MDLRLIGIIELEFLHPSTGRVELLRSLDEPIQVRLITMTANLRRLKYFQPCTPLFNKHRQ
jgi:hypothetical protein